MVEVLVQLVDQLKLVLLEVLAVEALPLHLVLEQLEIHLLLVLLKEILEVADQVLIITVVEVALLLQDQTEISLQIPLDQAELVLLVQLLDHL